MNSFKNLTSGEETLMHLLWKMNGGYLKDIMQAYPEPKPHQNTISTFLKNLVEKNYIKAVLEGRINRYEITVQKGDYKIMLLKNFIQNFYDNNSNELLLDMMNEGFITLSVSENPEKEKGKDKKKKKKKKK